MSVYVAGIDGGQSSTTALIADERGRIMGRGVAGPADEVGAGPESTRLRDALHDALERARAAAGLPEPARFAAIVAGISGYEGRIYGAHPDLPTERLALLHDAPIAHAGALAGEPGVVVIAGTGSVVYARNQRGESKTFGGWGYVFGDEGSAFRIAADALAMMMRAQDDGDESFADPTRAAEAYFKPRSLREIARAFYAGEVSRDHLAAFAPVALRSSDSFRAIAEHSADRLASLAARAIVFAESRKVALTGGTFADPQLRSYLEERIRDLEPSAQIVEPKYEPAAGALLLAYRQLDMPAMELVTA